MKTALAALVLALSALSVTIYKAENPCASPLQYSIGTFDTQFGVSKEDFEKKIEAGASIWEKAFNKDFFEYNAKSKFKINLIYDQRQKNLDFKRKTEFGLSQAEAVFKALDLDFKSIKAKYESRSASYESSKQSFLARSKAYERDVETVNAKGGANPVEYAQLKQMQLELNASAKQLNAEAEALNNSLAELNPLLEKRNKAANDYNSVAAAYNQKYGHGLEFDQAEYTGKEINVYEFSGGKDLVTALAHELGHALGMNHIEDQKSIMYYRTGDQTGTPTSADLAELKRVCKL